MSMKTTKENKLRKRDKKEQYKIFYFFRNLNSSNAMQMDKNVAFLKLKAIKRRTCYA